MKKKIAFSIAVLSIFIVSYASLDLNVYRRNQGTSYYDLKLKNIEVLAFGEDTGYLNRLSCYRTMSSSGSGNMTHITYCGSCEPRLCRAWFDSSSCYE